MDVDMGAAGPGDGSPRLVIKELALENFKSYAGVQRVGPFHKASPHLLPFLAVSRCVHFHISVF
eukprot:scaffold215791_cov47-Prasinocladus_malaysianus.AAC.1